MLAYTTEDSYPIVPKSLALAYMRGPWFQPAGARVSGTDMPLLSFVVASIGMHGPQNDLRAHKLAELFVRRGADVNAEYEGFTPLHTAIMADSSVTVRLLLELGADRDRPISRRESPSFGRSAIALAEHLAVRGKISQRTLSALKGAA